MSGEQTLPLETQDQSVPPDISEVESDVEGFLSFSHSIRTYAVNELDRVFADMANSLPIKDDISAHAQKLVRAASTLGTHTMKSTSPRADKTPLSFLRLNTNRPPTLQTLGDAQIGKYAKVLCRPIAIEGCEGEASLVSRLIEGCPHLPALERSFQKAFGLQTLIDVKAAITQRQSGGSGIALHHENFPIFFIPGPDGTDLQTTPLSAAESWIGLRNLKNAAWHASEHHRAARLVAKAEKGDSSAAAKANEIRKNLPAMIDTDLPAAGDWLTCQPSTKFRNVAMQVASGTCHFHRLFAKMPEALSDFEAALWHAATGSGRFPRLLDHEAGDALVAYAGLLDTYRADRVQDALDGLADRLIRTARAHIDDVAAEITRRFGPQAVPDPLPGIVAVLRDVPVRDKVDRALARAALNHSHFTSRLDIRREN